MTVSVSLPDELSDFLDERVASGRYASASDVVQDALRLMEQHEENKRKLEWLREAYRVGIESGDGGPLDAESIKAEARARRDARST